MEYAKDKIGTKGDEAIVLFIGPALVSCTQPLKLLFIFCNLSDVGATALAAAVASCHCLTHLAVLYNPDITSAGYDAQRQAVVASPSLLQQVILFDGAKIDEKTSKDQLQRDEEARRREKEEEDRFRATLETMTQLLVGLDIDPDSAEKYAPALIKDGFSTPAKFALVEENDLVHCQVSHFHLHSILAAIADVTLVESSTQQAHHLVGSARVNLIETILQQRNKTRAVFISYHQGDAAADANMMYEYLTTKGGLDPSTVFFDKNQLQDIRQLTAEIKSSCVMIQMQSKELYFRPYTLLEAAVAFKSGVKVIPVATVSYDFVAAAKFLGERDFVAALDRANPGASEALCKAGVDPAEVGRIVAREFPNLRSYKFHANETPRVMNAELADVLDQVLLAMGVAASESE
jgi:hypothetical protein